MILQLCTQSYVNPQSTCLCKRYQAERCSCCASGEMFSWYLLPTSLLYHLFKTYCFYLNQSVPADACEPPWTCLRCTRVLCAENSLPVSLWKTRPPWLAASFNVSLCSTKDKWETSRSIWRLTLFFFFSLIPSRKITSKSKHIKAAFWNHLLNIVYYMPEAGPCFPVTTRRINLPQSFHQTTSYNSTGSLALLLIGLRCQSSTGRKKGVLLMLWHHLNEPTQNNLQNRQG